MAKNNLENELRNLKNLHLTESELAAYCDQELSLMRRARVEAHVKQCFRCKEELALLLEESAALSHPPGIVKEIPLQERLAEYFRQMVASWRLYFGQGALRGEADQGEEVWRWQSEDGKLQARAMMEKNADMIVHFSSNEMALEGARLHFRLGSLNQETTLRWISESEVAAEIAIPWPFRQSNVMADISIEIV